MKTSSKLLSGLLIGLFVFLSTSFHDIQAQGKGKDVMIVEIIFSFNGPQDVSGIYISKPDGKTDKIPLIGFVGEENIQKNGITIAQQMKKIYDDGWTLESSCGGDNSKRYIFIK